MVNARQSKSYVAVRAGKRIASIRALRGLSQAGLEEKTNGKLSKTRIANYEQGTRELGISEAQILGEALEVAPSYLMGLVDEIEGEFLSYPADLKFDMVSTLRKAQRDMVASPVAPYVAPRTTAQQKQQRRIEHDSNINSGAFAAAPKPGAEEVSVLPAPQADGRVIRMRDRKRKR